MCECVATPEREIPAQVSTVLNLHAQSMHTSKQEDDPFVCDISGALISMIKDGRYHFNDGRGPDDPSAVCMVSVSMERGSVSSCGWGGVWEGRNACIWSCPEHYTAMHVHAVYATDTPPPPYPARPRCSAAVRAVSEGLRDFRQPCDRALRHVGARCAIQKP